jgi:protein-S-isoprenylcysteine O-methyltransferase Ste14
MKKKIQSFISIIFTIGILIGSGFIINPSAMYDTRIWVIILALFVMFSTQPPMKKSDLMNPDDQYSMLGILVMAIIVHNLAVIEWVLKSENQHGLDGYAIIGLLMIWGGIAFRVYAIKKLSYYFSNITEIKKEHQIINDGIYGKIRHPSYTGAICTMIGILIWLESWNSIGICLGLITLAYWHRITQEEKLLIKHFGKKYVQYRQKTGLLFPKIL